jgi:hypothetical protein
MQLALATLCLAKAKRLQMLYWPRNRQDHLHMVNLVAL